MLTTSAKPRTATHPTYWPLAVPVNWIQRHPSHRRCRRTPPRLPRALPPPPPRPPAGLEWGNEGWRRMTWSKVFVLDEVVDWGFNLVVSDVDVVWFKDPLPLFAQHPHAGARLQSAACRARE